MLPALVDRELRIALRRDARKQWIKAAWTAGTLTALYLLIFSGPAFMSGAPLFRLFFFIGSIVVITRGFGITADLFSEERRNGTLGLLVLTGLRPLEIFGHKLAGAAFLASYSLLGALPFFALPFLMGGVLASEFVCSLVFMANLILFCIAFGLLGSVLHTDSGQAEMTAWALAALLCLATPAAYWITQRMPSALAISHGWLELSPAYAFYLVFKGGVKSSPQAFWSCSGFTLVYSIVALLLAAVVLQRTWRDQLTDGSAASPFRRWLDRLFSKTVFNPKQPFTQWEGNPFCKLAVRKAWPVTMARMVLLTVMLVWFGGWALSGSSWIKPPTAFACAALLHAGLFWAMTCAAGARLGVERQTGGLEIVLTTPLSIDEILRGQARALWLQFRTTLITAFIFDLTMFSSAVPFENADPQALFAYLLIWVLLFVLSFALHREATCKAMWISLWTGRPVYAALHATNRMVFVLFFSAFILRGFTAAQLGIALFYGVIVVGVSSICFNRTSIVRAKILKEARSIAAAPIPQRNDPNFKKWVPELINAPGRWGHFELKSAPARRTTRTATRVLPPQ